MSEESSFVEKPVLVGELVVLRRCLSELSRTIEICSPSAGCTYFSGVRSGRLGRVARISFLSAR